MSAQQMVSITDRCQLVAFGFSFSICYGTGVGLGRHEANVAAHDRESLKKAEYAFSVLYVRARQEAIQAGHLQNIRIRH